MNGLIGGWMDWLIDLVSTSKKFALFKALYELIIFCLSVLNTQIFHTWPTILRCLTWPRQQLSTGNQEKSRHQTSFQSSVSSSASSFWGQSSGRLLRPSGRGHRRRGHSPRPLPRDKRFLWWQKSNHDLRGRVTTSSASHQIQLLLLVFRQLVRDDQLQGRCYAALCCNVIVTQVMWYIHIQ